MGEKDVFPHVGRDTQMRLEGARGSVYPIVTYENHLLNKRMVLFRC